MMIVILEGPRGTGKTTLCLELVSRLQALGLPAELHKGQRIGDPIEGMISTIREKFTEDKIWIVDRFHLTEWVMSIHLERRDFVELTKDIRCIDIYLHQAGALGVILDAPDVVIADRVVRRNDGRGFEMPLERSRKLWEAAAALSGFMSVCINDIDQFETVMHDLIGLVRSRWTIFTMLKEHEIGNPTELRRTGVCQSERDLHSTAVGSL